MKMKEAITATGLTDRAIRLYIENGLVSPSCNESYAGRKNLDFTEENIQELCNIAILRKAGFSINEIKQLRLDEESCRKVLREFMGKTSERIKSDKEVLEKLKAVAEDENITVQTICDSLCNVTKEKLVPVTDTKLSLSEKIEKYFFMTLASIGIAYICGCILYVILVCKLNYDFYTFPAIKAIDLYFFKKLFIVIFVVGSCIYLLYTYRKRIIFEGKKKRFIVNIAVSMISVLLCIPFFFFTIWSFFEPNVCSKTTSPKNYMVLDDDVKGDDITDFFPYQIEYYATNHPSFLLLDLPDTYTDSTKYYYKNYWSEYEIFTEIYTEWTLLDKYSDNTDYTRCYEKHKKKYLEMKFDKPVTVKTKGDWQCVYYDDVDEDDWSDSYYYRIFAYNDKTKTVRFIYASHKIKTGALKENIPKFTKLEW